MKQEQFDLFHDEDDPPPKAGYSDFHWWCLNRWAEELARILRRLGLY